MSELTRRCGRGRRESGPPIPWDSRQASTPRSPGPIPLHVHLAQAGRRVCWPALPACQLAQSTQWLAPRPLGRAAGPPPTDMQLAARSRWAGWPGRWLIIKLPAGFAMPGALAPLGWHRWAARLTCWLPMDGHLAQAAERRVLSPLLAAPRNVRGHWPMETEARTYPLITLKSSQ